LGVDGGEVYHGESLVVGTHPRCVRRCVGLIR